MKLSRLAALAAAVLMSAPALAHDDATLDATAAPHGGQLRMAGAYHLELVLARDARGGRPAPVKVYLTDHGGKPVAPTGVSGNVVLLAPAGKLMVPLAPAGGGLAGTAAYAADPATKAVVSLRFADGRTESARFEPFKPR